MVWFVLTTYVYRISTIISITFICVIISVIHIQVYVYSVHLGVGEGIYCTFLCYAYAPWFLYFNFGLDLGFMNVLYAGVDFIGQGSTFTNVGGA